MRIKVRVGGQDYQVEVGDLNTRPIVAMVDDERFEIWPEDEPAGPAGVPRRRDVLPGGNTSTRSMPVPRAHPGRTSPPVLAAEGNQTQRVVLAPLPGSIDSVGVQPGDTVRGGQPLCVIEAMKMKNTIRAPRDGTIATVRIAGGQHVQHGDVLVEYVD